MFRGCGKLLMKNVLLTSVTVREMTKVDRKRGTCLPMAGVVSRPAPHQGSRGNEGLNQNQDSASSLADYKGSCSSVCSRAGTTFDGAPACS